MKYKMIKIIYLIIMMLFVFQLKDVSALVCTSSNYNNLMKQARNVKISYELVHGKGEWPYYKLTVLNMTKDIMFKFNNEKYIYGYEKENPSMIHLYGTFETGTTVTIDLQVSDENACFGNSLKSISVKLPYFNHFYDYDECLKYPEFRMCARTFNSDDISDEEFLAAVAEYEKTIKPEEEPNEEKLNLFEKIINFVKENIVVVSICTVVLVFVIVIVLHIRRKKKVRIVGLEQ